ncbi:3-isopropylmalate dehydratase large subunit [Paraferrimonas sedimenticola]|uniref:3-isopropylmalate dehydratase large subunit n=1 Tax=Paraferrimonas sedimenticola TaxID=375674 RepID=A0AA37RWH2_9GAMM|nr:3-isopropylmalate dehydratase large subunit [Paraferrimonas sedimenticola]GLP96368.1 3-isopropylmalate dehydratase large subunit [Paraferrimonas sedimenticola]
MTQGMNLFDKVWFEHQVSVDESGNALLYIDRHIIHEITSAQAFDGLRIANRPIWRKESLLAMADHQVPTQDRELGDAGFPDKGALIQVKTLNDNCETNDVAQYGLDDDRHGIVHVAAPEQGAVLPGMTLVCGDSHSSTHGAFAVLAQGIGTSDVEHVMASQCLLQQKPKVMRIVVNGQLGFGVTAKDLALYLISQIGCAGASGYAIEYAGDAVQALSMEGRMTLCNMSIEMGARCGMVAFDQTTQAYLEGLPNAPKGQDWQQALDYWQTLSSDTGATFDAEFVFEAADIAPQVSWGTKPDQTIAIGQTIPSLAQASSSVQSSDWARAYEYMGVGADACIGSYAIDQVFIGSCTNGRLEDIRAVAEVVKGRKLASHIKRAMVVPGSAKVKRLAESEGLDKILVEAGFQWREAGCSMCNAMNPDRLEPGERCASTSNRNFEGRQGLGGRTHLVSPAMAAAAAIAGHFVDVRQWQEN